jgi:hypothetical protein
MPLEEIGVDGQYATLARSASMISALDSPGRPQQMVEAANGKRE